MKKSKSWKLFFLVVISCMIFFMTSCNKNDESGKMDEATTEASSTEEESVTQTGGVSTENVTTTVESTTEAEPEIVLDEAEAVTVWTTSSLNLRKKPDTTAEVLKVLAKGAEITKYDETNGWILVKAGDMVGYVSKDYIADEKPVEPEPAPASSGGSKVEAIPGQKRDPNHAVVVIDPGHQRQGDSTQEPNGPGSSTMKARVTYGTTGVASGEAEYVLNLDVSMKLKAELENRGYTVYMTRTSHDVNISNMERAQYGNSVGADAVVRVHANAASAGARGAETLSPTSSNPYVSHLASASRSLSQCVIDGYCNATGIRNRGVQGNDTMTGINWSEVPVTIIELGFMSNAEEDLLMQDENMQNNMAQGIANGLDAYFGF